MVLRLCGLVVSAVCALALPALAQASGGSYAFDGGTPQEQAQVRAALEASSFNWGVVPARITIHIVRGRDSDAMPGEIWLDADLVDAGKFAWGTVQHEYAHQVDFLVINPVQRARLAATLGGSAWYSDAETAHEHAELGCERFASTLAWTFWQSKDNSMKPTSVRDESAAMAPAAFKALLTDVAGANVSNATRLTRH
jgi:hypothetical protein